MAWTNPKTWVADSTLTASELNTHLRDNLNAIAGWTAYTPTWAGTGGTPSIGNGSIAGSYRTYGDVCEVRVLLTWGSTTTANTATSWTFTLPVTATGFTAVAGAARLADASAVANYPAVTALSTTTTVVVCTAAGGFVGATTPFTWATSDTLTFQFTYEV